jgi:YHS domain-containing protein
MIRLIVFALLAYLAYRLARRWLTPGPGPRRADGGGAGRIDDVMVKDPHCGSYFPRRDGISTRHDGQELLFCSRDCRDKFIAHNSNPPE